MGISFSTLSLVRLDGDRFATSAAVTVLSFSIWTHRRVPIAPRIEHQS
jgi:hypothetical protein